MPEATHTPLNKLIPLKIIQSDNTSANEALTATTVAREVEGISTSQVRANHELETDMNMIVTISVLLSSTHNALEDPALLLADALDMLDKILRDMITTLGVGKEHILGSNSKVAFCKAKTRQSIIRRVISLTNPTILGVRLGFLAITLELILRILFIASLVLLSRDIILAEINRMLLRTSLRLFLDFINRRESVEITIVEANNAFEIASVAAIHD